uniref:hypothetical protein n=1 Tax=Aquiflexum sp. TaxID=1872584 RepID=UPI00359482AE
MKISSPSINFTLLCLIPIFYCCQQLPAEKDWEIVSPNGNLSARFHLEPDSSGLIYEVFSMEEGNKKSILLPAPLGLMREDQGFYSGLVFEEI